MKKVYEQIRMNTCEHCFNQETCNSSSNDQKGKDLLRENQALKKRIKGLENYIKYLKVNRFC